MGGTGGGRGFEFLFFKEEEEEEVEVEVEVELELRCGGGGNASYAERAFNEAVRADLGIPSAELELVVVVGAREVYEEEVEATSP